jgi:hypothetical protein
VKKRPVRIPETRARTRSADRTRSKKPPGQRLRPSAPKTRITRTPPAARLKRVAQSKRAARKPAFEAAPVTARELRALKRELARRTAPTRWNPNPDDVQKSVAQLVLTIVEFLRKLMERQAIRRMEARTLTPKEVEAVGLALMQLEETVREIGKKFGITPEELNLDLGAIKLM